MNRPHRADVLMVIARIVATRGTCDRAQVGAVFAREGRIITVGYNGAPPGLPHCEENYHGWGSHNAESLKEFGCRNATHAEANALAFAAKYGVATEGAELFVTVSPCETCARLLIAAGIVNVTCDMLYRDKSGVDLLSDAGVTVSWARES